jgi:glycerophosphoryl diester phosphodiesterase
MRWNTLDGTPTRIIAHRGASGPLPEHTLPAYSLALEQGADVLEPDLVISRDAQLMVRHDRGLARSTDVALHPQFASRAVDGDWPVERFARAELGVLRALQPFGLRDASHDRRHGLLDFAQLLDWAEATARARGAPVTLYPELKHPSQFAALGLDPVPPFVARALALDPSRVPLWVQCFEPEPLQRVREAAGLPVHLLLDAGQDWHATLARERMWLDGIGASKALLSDARGRDSGLVASAHAAGLTVHAWTYRDDRVPEGVRDVEEELRFAFALGVDAVFCDFPATGLDCRARFARGS